MAPRLLDNALLLIKLRNQCNHKTIVVVYIDRNVACKQLHLHNHSTAFVSDNTKYPLIMITDEDGNHRTGDKNRTEFGGGLAAIKTNKRNRTICQSMTFSQNARSVCEAKFQTYIKYDTIPRELREQVIHILAGYLGGTR